MVDGLACSLLRLVLVMPAHASDDYVSPRRSIPHCTAPTHSETDPTAETALHQHCHKAATGNAHCHWQVGHNHVASLFGFSFPVGLLAGVVGVHLGLGVGVTA